MMHSMTVLISGVYYNDLPCCYSGTFDKYLMGKHWCTCSLPYLWHLWIFWCLWVFLQTIGKLRNIN